MKVLLDENLPHDLRRLLPGHDVFTVAYMGWASTKNGALLKPVEGAGFNAMLTKDSGVEYEQYLPALPVSVVVIRAKTNKMDDIHPLVAEILSALVTLKPNTLARVG